MKSTKLRHKSNVKTVSQLIYKLPTGKTKRLFLPAPTRVISGMHSRIRPTVLPCSRRSPNLYKDRS